MTPSDEARRYSALLQNALNFDPENNPDLETLYAGLDEGRYQLWPATNSVGVTEIVQHPTERTCHIWLAAGDLAELQELFQACARWARHIGCARMTIVGRPGWERTWLRAADFRVKSVTFEKGL